MTAVGSYAQAGPTLVERAIDRAKRCPDCAQIIAELLHRDAAILRTLRRVCGTDHDEEHP